MDSDILVILSLIASLLAIGSVIYVSFGYADEREVKSLKDRIDNLESLLDHKYQNAVTYIQNIDSEIRKDMDNKLNKETKRKRRSVK